MQEIQYRFICYRLQRDQFISAVTVTLDPGKSTTEQKLIRENQELKSIIGDLTTANETLKNSGNKERYP